MTTTLTYIWHDCFLFATGEATILFDYWRDVTQGCNEAMPGFLKLIDKTKPFYVIVSHHHKDHFTKEIFEWSESFPNIHYIISKDVAKMVRHMLNPDSIYSGIRPVEGSVNILSRGDTFNDGVLKVRAFGSTDIGNSYAVEVAGMKIFHAGDLNAWIWKDESTTNEINAAIIDFCAILHDIKNEYPEFDIAMFPVDSRIGTDYFTGASIFLREIYVKRFFPMHFGLGTPAEQAKFQFDAGLFSKYANPDRGEYIMLSAPYASVLFTHC